MANNQAKFAPSDSWSPRLLIRGVRCFHSTSSFCYGRNSTEYLNITGSPLWSWIVNPVDAEWDRFSARTHEEEPARIVEVYHPWDRSTGPQKAIAQNGRRQTLDGLLPTVANPIINPFISRKSRGWLSVIPLYPTIFHYIPLHPTIFHKKMPQNAWFNPPMGPNGWSPQLDRCFQSMNLRPLGWMKSKQLQLLWVTAPSAGGPWWLAPWGWNDFF